MTAWALIVAFLGWVSFKSFFCLSLSLSLEAALDVGKCWERGVVPLIMIPINQPLIKWTTGALAGFL